MAKQADFLEFPERDHWRMWLENNHATEKDAWLIVYKKAYHHEGLALADAVEEALCFGWIDGTLNRVDEKRFALRFSPRKRNSIWSVSNIERVQKLAEEGKMTQAGLSKVSEAKENGQWEAAIRREQVKIIPEELEKALQEINGALSAYQALPSSRKKRYIYWLQSAKRNETKLKRIQKIIDEVVGK